MVNEEGSNEAFLTSFSAFQSALELLTANSAQIADLSLSMLNQVQEICKLDYGNQLREAIAALKATSSTDHFVTSHPSKLLKKTRITDKHQALGQRRKNGINARHKDQMFSLSHDCYIIS